MRHDGRSRAGASSLRGHTGHGRSLAERFWAQTEKRGRKVCWEWRGAVTPTGYGKLQGRRPGSIVYAHRVCWSLHHRSISSGVSVLHRCDNPRCVNPAHLFIGSHKDNMRDMSRKGRCSNQRLNPFAVRSARKLRARGARVAEIAVRLGVHSTTIQRALSGRTWKHI